MRHDYVTQMFSTAVLWWGGQEYEGYFFFFLVKLRSDGSMTQKRSASFQGGCYCMLGGEKSLLFELVLFYQTLY